MKLVVVEVLRERCLECCDGSQLDRMSLKSQRSESKELTLPPAASSPQAGSNIICHSSAKPASQTYC